ncbi:MAG: DUF4352 domain-containing protein [Anaerolineae bacterium]
MRYVTRAALIGVFLLAVPLSACNGTGGTPTTVHAPTTPPAPTTAPTGQAPAAASANHCPVGVRCFRGDTALTVHQVSKMAEGSAHTPPPGRAYLMLNITIQNIGRDPFFCSPQDFAARDATGAEYVPVTMVGQESPFTADSLWPQDQLRGNLVFEIPADASGLQLIYRHPEQDESTSIRVRLGL